MLTIYGRANSFNVQKVMWLVAELGLPHRRLDVGGPFGGTDTPEYKAMNPHGLVPTLDDDGTVIWESNSILRYLAGLHAPDALWPKDPAARAHVDQWIEWAQTALQPSVLGLWMATWRTPPAQQDAKLIAQKTAQSVAEFQKLDALMANRPFVMGDRMTLADIPIGSTLFRWTDIEVERPAMPNVAAYYDRLKKNPHYARHVMVPVDDLKGRLSW